MTATCGACEERPVVAPRLGLCNTCYHRWRSWGDPLYVTERPVNTRPPQRKGSPVRDNSVNVDRVRDALDGRIGGGELTRGERRLAVLHLSRKGLLTHVIADRLRIGKARVTRVRHYLRTEGLIP